MHRCIELCSACFKITIILVLLIQEILNNIVEQGASFKELEYRNAVILLQRSSSAFDQKQKQRQLKKLEEIMMEAV